LRRKIAGRPDRFDALVSVERDDPSAGLFVVGPTLKLNQT
jgi:hypothetical protein